MLRALTLCAVAIVPMLGSGDDADRGGVAAPRMVTLQPQLFVYRLAGEFSRDGEPMAPPARWLRLPHAFAIMARQVTAADYRRCVVDRGCATEPLSAGGGDRPVVQVSWHDATAYAAWLSRRLGTAYRLPTDEEWAFAAGSRFRGEPVPGGNDPGQIALKRHDLEAAHDGIVDPTPRTVGSFGTNENGIADMAGNVWEWTNTCLVHQVVGSDETRAAIVNCGVRVVEGRHRTYMVDFVRDPRAGGCSVGKPPSNLGFRLVRESSTWK